MAGSEPATDVNDWVFINDSEPDGACLVVVSPSQPSSLVGVRLNGVVVPLLVYPADSEVEGSVSTCYAPSQYVLYTSEWLEDYGDESWQYGQVFDAVPDGDNAFEFEAFGGTIRWDAQEVPLFNDIDLDIPYIGY